MILIDFFYLFYLSHLYLCFKILFFEITLKLQELSAEK